MLFRSIFDQLVAICLARAGGDWGHRTQYTAANLANDLAGMEPAWAFDHTSAFLGAFLTAIGQLGTAPTSSLITAGGVSPHERAMEAFTRQSSIASAAREFLSAVEKAASANPVAVCSTVTVLIADERDNNRGLEAAWRLLPLLGRVGQSHGADPGVLAAILPVLHTYMVSSETALRSAALKAWAEIGVSHQLPSSVADLLPALLTDPYVAVVRAVLAAARSLTWGDDDRILLFVFAYRICESADADRGTPMLKDAMATLDVLAGGDGRLRTQRRTVALARTQRRRPTTAPRATGQATPMR